jgi:hypothetical protein
VVFALFGLFSVMSNFVLKLLEFWRVPVRKRKCSVVDKAVMLCLTWCLGNSTVVEVSKGLNYPQY